MSEAKAGTFWGWLFGHCFVASHSNEEEKDGRRTRTWGTHITDYCVRCGAARKERG